MGALLARLPTTDTNADGSQSWQNRILSQGAEGYESCAANLVAVVSPPQVDWLSPDEVTALELATGIPIVYELNAAGESIGKKILND